MNTFERRILGHRLSPQVEEVFFEVEDVGLDVEVGWDGEREREFESVWNREDCGILEFFDWWFDASRQVEAGWGIGERGFGLETLESERRQVGLDDLLG